MEPQEVDSLCRPSVNVGGYSFTLVKIIPFEEWIKQKHVNFNEFLDLPSKDKEKTFLRWKWGSSYEESNSAAETSRMSFLQTIKQADFTKLNEGYQYYFQNVLDFEKICLDVKRQIGLEQIDYSEAPDDVKEAVDVFGGKII